jgi:hypothetical protein
VTKYLFEKLKRKPTECPENTRIDNIIPGLFQSRPEFTNVNKIGTAKTIRKCTAEYTTIE